MNKVTPERWRQIDRILDAALEIDPSGRAAFLNRECAGDVALQREVESLLECAIPAETFLEYTALQEAAVALAADRVPLVGREIGGYRLVSMLGAGGMGEVFRARDLKLERDVALKVIERPMADSDYFCRLEEEARAASGLNHPNIVTIYAVGEQDEVAYIAMELVHGRTLREILSDGLPPAKDALAYAVQLADGLAAAHGMGVVHRDLKPDNVMVTPDGLVKVLDFGVAKRGHPIETGASASAVSASQSPPRDDVIVGTAGYMSPEQAAGRPVDYRSDQFSFGVILSELLPGQGEPQPPRSPALQQVLDRCLSSDPEGRYSRPRDLAAELRALQDARQDHAGAFTRRGALWLGATAMAAAAIGVTAWRFWPAGPAIRTIAVLPFANPLRDEDADYLCDGIADSLIRRLSALQTTRVVALSAVMHFKGANIEARAAGRQLNADAVITGSVQRRGGRLIVNAELVDVATGTRLWGNVFDRPEADVLAVHDEVAAAIIKDGIHVALDTTQQGRFGGALTDDPRAYDLYLQAVHHFRLEREEDYLAARDLLARAVAQAPSFALAYVTLASTYSVMAIDGYEPPKKAWPQSILNVARALDLDPDLPDAHAEASASAFFYRWDWAAAEREWQAAMRSRRSEVQPELLTSYALQKWALGEDDKALQFARAARLADPLSAGSIVREADLLAKTGRLDAAAALYEKVIHDAGDDDRAFTGLAEVRRMQGRFDDAIEVRRRAYQAAGDGSLDAVFAAARGADGYTQIERADARLRLAALEFRRESGVYVSPLEFARVHAVLGDNEVAFRFLAAALDERAAGLVFLNVDPSWTSVRKEPEFKVFVRKVGLETT